jgi:plastocyanin
MRALPTILITAAIAVGTQLADAEPRRGKPKPATLADIERLEKKIDDQQRTIDKLIRLQQQYLQALSSMFDGKAAAAPSAPTPVTDVRPVAPDPKPVAEPNPDPKPRAIVRDRDRNRAGDKDKDSAKKEASGAGTIVGKIAGAEDAIVYVDTIVAPTRGTASMKQEGKQFLPRVLVVTKGTTVSFPNRDAIFHNVFSVTPDHSFDLGSYPQGETRTVKMSKSGVVTVYCNMHPQMVGHILVVPNGNHVRAGKDGFFRMPNIPAGNHRVVAWAPNSKSVTADATVIDGETTTVELVLKKGRAMPHTKKDGLPYGSYDK